jgi:hypothetical protein
MFSKQNEINSIFKEAKNDYSLKSTINIEEILKNADSTNNYLKTKKIKDINKEVFDVLCTLDNSVIAEKYANKLIGFRLVDEIFELHKGKMVKLISKETQKMKLGGIVLNIKILDSGIHFLCLNNKNVFQFRFDDYYIFQKLTVEEEIIMA